MTNRNDYYEDELSLLDIYKVLKHYRRSILLTPLISTFAAALFTFLFIEPCYKAYGTIQIGQVKGILLENGYVLQDRMKDMSFISEVISAHPNVFKYEKNLAAEEAWLQKGLDVKKNKDTDLVSFTLLSHTPERAKLKSLALIDTLNQKHSELYKANVQMVHNQIDMLTKQIDAANHDSDEFRAGITKSRGLNSYNALVDALVVRDQGGQLRDLVTKKLELETSLNPAVTFNTKLLGHVYVSKEPVSPNLPLVAAIAFLVGLFGSVFVAFVRHSLSPSVR